VAKPQQQSVPTSGERLSSLSEGLTAGYRYADANRHDRTTLKTIARARSVADITAAVDPARLEPHELGDQTAFWSGFAHGVAKFLVENSGIDTDFGIA